MNETGLGLKSSGKIIVI